MTKELKNEISHLLISKEGEYADYYQVFLSSVRYSTAISDVKKAFDCLIDKIISYFVQLSAHVDTLQEQEKIRQLILSLINPFDGLHFNDSFDQ